MSATMEPAFMTFMMGTSSTRSSVMTPIVRVGVREMWELMVPGVIQLGLEGCHAAIAEGGAYEVVFGRRKTSLLLSVRSSSVVGLEVVQLSANYSYSFTTGGERERRHSGCERSYVKLIPLVVLSRDTTEMALQFEMSWRWKEQVKRSCPVSRPYAHYRA